MRVSFCNNLHFALPVRGVLQSAENAVGSIAFRDNRRTWHLAAWGYYPQTRSGFRVVAEAAGILAPGRVHGAAIAYAFAILFEGMGVLQHYIAGVDVGAVKGMLASYGLLDDGRENSMVARSRQAFMSSKPVGSAETIARRIVDTVRSADLDGMMLVFPDFIEDLKGFGERILPLVRHEIGGAA